ncbi:MAG TPA: DegT/DnrJ/EryC1/StrS family aminotransferase [Anaerolineae bacterium]|nr:DegT/DnrJ/EryC1/StrS family aminotransferase [Anaerolineae bacterium]
MSNTKKIPFVDLVSQHSRLSKEIEEAIGDVLARGSFTLGGTVQRFEEEFAAFCGVDYAVGVGSGTDALHFALRALGVGPGDEVITVPNTYIATVEAIVMCGARPVFVDIDEDTHLMDASQLEGAITEKTKAIIPVHLYGQPADMQEICRIAARRGLKVVEDACQAHGASMAGIRTGCFGDAACFSFYPSKNLGAVGDGGIVVTNNKEVYERIARLRSHGEESKYTHTELGYCSRLHGIQAAVLGIKLKYLDRWNKARRYNAGVYDSHFESTPIIKPVCKDLNDHVYHLYVIRTKDRDELREHLAAQNIETGIHYPIPIHLQPSMQEYGYKKGDFPVTERVVDEIVSLPMFPELEDSDIERVASEVISFSLSRPKAA